jgi:universal stress protein A
MKKILCPTDYTDLSELALRNAATLAQDYHAHLIVLHAVETLGPENLTYGEAVSRRQPDAYRQRLWDELHQHVQLAKGQFSLELVLSEDDPVQAIVHTAAEHDCDLIVLGSHGRHGFWRLLEGSVAENVMRRAHCPVLVVKDPKTPRETNSEAATALHPHSLTETEH